MAGILLTAVGLGGVLLIDFATFLVGIATILLVRIPAPHQAAIEKPQTSFREEFLAGFRFLWEKRPFLYLTCFITLTVGTLGAYQTLYPPLILTLGTEATLGIANTLIGVSSLVGTTILSIIVIRRRMRAIYIAGLVMGISGLIAGWQPSLFSMIPALAIGFGVLPILIGLNRVLYQVKAPAAILGRVFAFRLAVGTTAQTLGALLAGLLVEGVLDPLLVTSPAESGRGAALALIVTGTLYLVGTLLAIAVRPLRQLELRLPDQDAGARAN
jgi:hypothetical protein